MTSKRNSKEIPGSASRTLSAVGSAASSLLGSVPLPTKESQEKKTSSIPRSRSNTSFLNPYEDDESLIEEALAEDNKSLIEHLMTVDDVMGLPPAPIVQAQRKTKPKEEAKPEHAKKEAAPVSDDNEDDWVVTPSFVNSTKQNQMKMIDKLTHTSEAIRLQGCNDLKVTITYDEVFGVRILPELFSIFSQATVLLSLSSLELLKIILKICTRSKTVVILEYKFHLFNSLKVLAKRNELQSWNPGAVKNADPKRDQLTAALTSKLSQLIRIFQPQSSDVEVWQIATPILVQIVCQLKKLFNPGSTLVTTASVPTNEEEALELFSMKDLMYNNRDRFSADHISKLFAEYYKFGEKPELAHFLIDLYYLDHPQVFNDQFVKELTLTEEAISQNTNLSRVLFCLSFAHQLVSRKTLNTSHTTSFVTSSILSKIVRVCTLAQDQRVLNSFMGTMKSLVLSSNMGSAVFDQIPVINSTYDPNHCDQEYRRSYIYLIGILGYDLSRTEKKEAIEQCVEMLLKVNLDSKLLALELLKALNNIVEAFTSPKIQELIQSLTHFEKCSDLDLRREAAKLFHKTEAGKKKKPEDDEDEVEDIGELNQQDDYSEQILDLQGGVEKHNLKLAEQQLEIAKLQQLVSSLQQQLMKLSRGSSKISSEPSTPLSGSGTTSSPAQ